MISPSSEQTFILDPKLAASTFFVKDLPLSRLLLNNDARYPWVILVPRRANKIELIDLEESDYAQLTQEIREISRLLLGITKPDKLNVATIGNIVAQLHIHIVARFQSDETWPSPVWGRGAALFYSPQQAQDWCEKLRDQF